MVAMQAHTYIVTHHLEVPLDVQSKSLQMGKRDKSCLGGVGGAHCYYLALEVVHRPDWRVGAHYDQGAKVAVCIAHGDGTHAQAALGCQALRVEPGQGGVPGNVDIAIDEVLNLLIVIGIEHVIERKAVIEEIVLEPVPYSYYLWIIFYGP